MAQKWTSGWSPLAKRADSPNFGARPSGVSVDLVVLHSISLPPGQFGTNQVPALFMNRLDWDAHPYFATIRGMQVSSHFYIERNGLLWQFVSCDDRAWHAGESSYLGQANCNDNSIGIELEGLEGGCFELIQYETLARICLDLRRQYPIAHVAGHEHIAPGRKFDPGSGFDWADLQRRTAWDAAIFPIQTQPEN